MVLKWFGMEQLQSVLTLLDNGVKLIKGTVKEKINNSAYYQPIVRSLMYTVTGTKAELAYITTLVSWYSSCPISIYLTVSKHCLQYLSKMKDWIVKFQAKRPLTFEVYIDADCTDRGRSFREYFVKTVHQRYPSNDESRMQSQPLWMKLKTLY